MSKVWVYVDGFNLYNGALRRSPHKWLDLVSLSQKLILPTETVERVKFFTARVEKRPADPDQQLRQRLYWRALRTLGNVDIIQGQFRSREKWLPDVSSVLQIAADERAGINVIGVNPSKSHVFKCEEKGTDVNLASHLIHDAHLGRFDAALIISNDSDLATAIRLVKQEVGKVVGVYSPQRDANLMELRRAASFYRKMPQAHLATSQLPATLTDHIGQIQKPPTW